MLPVKFPGGPRSKSWRINFEIKGDPKDPPSGSTFWLGFEVPDPCGYQWTVEPRPFWSLAGPMDRK